MEQPNTSSRGPDDSAGSGLASEAWVRSWFEDHYKAGDVFYDGPEALTIKAAVEFASAAMSLERERCIAAVEAVPTHQWVAGSDQWGNPCPAKIVATRADYVAAIRGA